MEGEGEADRKEESAGPRGGRGAKVVDDEAELGADRRREVGAERRREVVGGMAGLEARSALEMGSRRGQPGGVHGCDHPSNEAVRQWWQKPSPCEEERSPQS